MAAEGNGAVFSNSDDASIALLRRLRAGAAVDFVHHVDVCSAAPADLVADLEPAPGTDGACWYFYCPKKFKNAQGKASGHRQRAIGGGNTCWHAEARPKEVAGGGGGTACNLSYGRKDGRSFTRLGWYMMEYDDHHPDAGGDCGVLCKIYRSSRAQVKKTPPPCSTSKSATSKQAAKRKAAGAGEHPEARPAKLSRQQEQEQDDAFFTYDDRAVPPTVAQVNGEEWIAGIGCGPEMFGGEEEQRLSTEPTQDGGEFVETPYGPLPTEVAQVNVEEWIGGAEEMFGGGEEGHGVEQQTQTSSEQDNGFLAYPTAEDLFGQETSTSSGMPPAADPLPDADFFDGLESFFGVQEEQGVRMQQQPRAEPADPLVEFVQSQWMACQQQESQWMTMRRLLQGPPSFLMCP
ncbi:unnamed protein product [Urochloa humidicola]